MYLWGWTYHSRVLLVPKLVLPSLLLLTRSSFILFSLSSCPFLTLVPPLFGVTQQTFSLASSLLKPGVPGDSQALESFPFYTHALTGIF